MNIQLNPNETRIYFCYGPAASGKTTFAIELANQAQNPLWLDSTKQLTNIKPYPSGALALDHYDLVILDGDPDVSEDDFLTMLNWPTPKTFVICSCQSNEFIPEDDRAVLLNFPLQ